MYLPTTPADIKRINAMHLKLEPLMLSLYARWVTEKAFENINDYAEPIKKALPRGFTLLKMTKRPFGFKFSIGTQAEYAVILTSKAYIWVRVDSPSGAGAASASEKDTLAQESLIERRNFSLSSAKKTIVKTDSWLHNLAKQLPHKVVCTFNCRVGNDFTSYVELMWFPRFK